MTDKPHLKVVTMSSPSEPDPTESALLEGNTVRVLFDVDSVIADLVQVFISAIEAAGIRTLPKGWRPTQFDIATDLGFTKDEEQRMYKMLRLPGIADMVLPYKGAIAGVKKIANISDVFFVTTPMKGSPTWTFDRTAWLHRHFGEELGSKWVYTEYKYVVYGDILVDDKPENCAGFEKAWPGSIALRWVPLGQTVEEKLTNVNSWDMVYLFVEQYAQKKKLWRRK
jgi:5'(3')-deoxyribonucleotidase